MAIKGEKGEPWRNSRKFGIETASTGRKRREEREERILQPSANENYMRNPFPPWKPGFYRLVRNTGCLDKSNLSCSICICIRRQRALRRLLRVGTHRRSRVPFQIRVFANTPRTHAHTPSLSLSLFSSSLHGYLRISLFQLPRLCLATLVAKNPRRLSSSSSSERIFHPSHLTLFPAYRGSPSRSFVTLVYSKRLLPAFPPFPPVTCESSKVIESSSGVQFLNRETNPCFSEEGVSFVVRGKRCAIYEARYIYMYGYIGGPRGRGT